jgi:hypothetical protein
MSTGFCTISNSHGRLHWTARHTAGLHRAHIDPSQLSVHCNCGRLPVAHDAVLRECSTTGSSQDVWKAARSSKQHRHHARWNKSLPHHLEVLGEVLQHKKRQT